MPKRSITALLAALALLIAAPAAFAQTATPTPGGAPKDASEAVKEIYADFRDHGKIDECGHDRADLKDALDTIDPGFDTDNPDFRVGLEAAIQRHDDGKCSEDEGDATPTPTATASPAATASPDDGTLPPATDDGSTTTTEAPTTTTTLEGTTTTSIDVSPTTLGSTTTSIGGQGSTVASTSTSIAPTGTTVVPGGGSTGGPSSLPFTGGAPSALALLAVGLVTAGLSLGRSNPFRRTR